MVSSSERTQGAAVSITTDADAIPIKLSRPIPVTIQCFRTPASLRIGHSCIIHNPHFQTVTSSYRLPCSVHFARRSAPHLGQAGLRALGSALLEPLLHGCSLQASLVALDASRTQSPPSRTAQSQLVPVNQVVACLSWESGPTPTSCAPSRRLWKSLVFANGTIVTSSGHFSAIGLYGALSR